MKNRIEPTGQSAETPEPRAVTDAREVLAASKAATPSGDVDLARWWGRLEGALEFLLAAIDQGDEEPLAGDQGDGEECGEPDLAPLIVAAPTEPLAGNVEGAPVYPAAGELYDKLSAIQ